MADFSTLVESFNGVAAAEMFTNPTFNGNVTGWSAGGPGTAPTLSYGAANNRTADGTGALKITWATSTSANSFAGFAFTGLTIGKQYVFRAWIYVPTGNTTLPRIGAVGIATNAAGAAVYNTWTQHSVTFTATGTNHSVWVTHAGSTAGHVFYVDDVSLKGTSLELDTTRWNLGYVTASLSGSELLLRPDYSSWDNSLRTQVRWALADETGVSGTVEFVPHATRNNGNAGWGVYNNSNQGLFIEQNGASAYRSAIFDGASTTNTKDYATTDRYWQVQLDSGNIYSTYVFSSADKVTWTYRGTHSMAPGIGFTWRNAGVAEFFTYLRIAGGTGSTPVAAFRGINEVAITSVTAVVATSSGVRPPVVQQWTTIVSVPATAAVAVPEPTLKVSLGFPVAAATAAFPAPSDVHEILNTSLSPPAATAINGAAPPLIVTPQNVSVEAPTALMSLVVAYAPTIIAPMPLQVFVVSAIAETRAVAPEVSQLLNTTVEAPIAGATVLLLPPGEYVRLTTPAAAASSLLLAPLRVGPVLSRFASTVVQTPQNFGGAAVYYRLNDSTPTLTDTLGYYHGGWSGTRTLVDGSVADDADKAMEFDGTTTLAYNGLMPNYRPFTDAGTGSADSTWRADEWPRVWGWSAMIAFRTLPDTTKQLYLVSRSEQATGFIGTDATLTVDGGRLLGRFHRVNDYVEILSGPAVNDGAWHLAVMTIGSPLDDYLVNAGCRLYLDGVLQGTRNFAADAPTRPLTIGGHNSAPLMEGALDEYAEFDYAVTRWEVKELWNQLKNLTGPPLLLSPPPATTQVRTLVPTVRKSIVRPLNEFFDDFAAPFLDRSKWRDASPTARVINGSAVLRANGERLLTQDYFQAKDSTFIIRIDGLPLREGHVFIGLANENETNNDLGPGPIRGWDSLRRHRTIGFDIYRSTANGRTTTLLAFSCYGQTFTGPQIRQQAIPYVPDDPNYPSPHRWLRLDMDPGRNGGATWYTSADGVNWTERYDVHGGKANSITTNVPNAVTGAMESQTTVTYEDVGDFFLFDRDLNHEEQTEWRGFMRVLVSTDGGNAATTAAFDNVNVPPQGTGTPADILAKPARVQVSSSTEYLLYALQPRIYSSGQDVSVEAKTANASVRLCVPPEAVYVGVPVLTATATLLAPQRAGDALPIWVLAPAATSEGRTSVPTRAGEAQPIYVEPNQAQSYAIAHPPEFDTTQSNPAVPVGPTRQVTTLHTRRIRVTVTQN